MANRSPRGTVPEVISSLTADAASGSLPSIGVMARAKTKFFWRSVLSAPQALRVFVIGLVLICAPLFFHPGFEKYPHIHWWLEKLTDICSKAGDALLIAVLLILTTLDEETRLNLIEVVVRAASPKLIGRHLPDAVQASVFHYFRIEFVRNHLEIEYVLEPIQGKEYLKVISRIRGPVKHCGSSIENFQFAGVIDPSVVDPIAGEPKISCAQLFTEDGTVIFNLPGGQEAVKQQDGSYVFQTERQFLPGVTYNTMLETVEYRPISYILPLFIGTTVVTATVNAILPKHQFNVKLQLPTISGSDPQPFETYLGYEWQIREPLLPGQCILLTWWPKESVNN